MTACLLETAQAQRHVLRTREPAGAVFDKRVLLVRLRFNAAVDRMPIYLIVAASGLE